MASQIVFLMYHELEMPGRALCQRESGYTRYVLPVDDFRQQMQSLKDSGFRGVSVGEAVQYSPDPQVCITFDDGCETDLLATAPLLKEFGFGATFYITSGFLGTPGYLNNSQLRELDGLGFEIGCHSMTHPYLTDLTSPQLKREIADAKLQIEQIVGHSIAHFSCPGGRYDYTTLEVARRAGFSTVANSLFHANSPKTSPYELGRVAMLRGTPPEEFAQICCGRGLWRKRLQDRTRQGVRRVLGNEAYDRVRATLLGDAKK